MKNIFFFFKLILMFCAYFLVREHNAFSLCKKKSIPYHSEVQPGDDQQQIQYIVSLEYNSFLLSCMVKLL